MPSIDQDIAATMRHPVARAAIVLGVLALLLIAALGGFRKAQTRQSLPRVGAGQAAASDAYQITPLCAYTSDRLPGRRYPDADRRFLVLRLRVVNRMEYDWSGHLQKDVVWPVDGRGVAGHAEYVLRADDHSTYAQLPPRVPALVDLVWPVPAGAPVEGAWGLYQRIRMTRKLDTGEQSWLQQGPDTRIVMPVSAACAEVAA